MKKKILQITLLFVITLIGINQAAAMVSCEQAEPGEACKLQTSANMEEINTIQTQSNEGQHTVLPSNGAQNAIGVMLIHTTKLSNPKIQIVAQKGYQSPEMKNFRSPLF